MYEQRTEKTVSGRASISENRCDSARGATPRLAYERVSPIMVKVLPAPVCPYAMMVPLCPPVTPATTCLQERSYTTSWEELCSTLWKRKPQDARRLLTASAE